MGAALIVLGVLANNYVNLHVNLHDVIFRSPEQQFEGAIVPGWVAEVLIVATLVVTTVGLLIVMDSDEPTATE